MLFLLFRVAGSAYAVEARRVVELVPRVELRPLPHAPSCLAGLFHYRGSIVPVIDMSILMGSGACRPSLDTRIIVCDYSPNESAHALLGLLAEEVNDLENAPAASEAFPEMHLNEAPYLGRIVQMGETLVQLIALEHVLPRALREGLFGTLAERPQ